MRENPYKVPPFKTDRLHCVQAQRFSWWSWHPNYPHWSRSCWGGATEKKARQALARPMALKMCYFHNKLMYSADDGRLVEVADRPCRALEVWREIARSRAWNSRPADAKPIRDWENS